MVHTQATAGATSPGGIPPHRGTLGSPLQRQGGSNGSLASMPGAASGLCMPTLLPFDRDSPDDRNELVATLVHTADLSGQAYPTALSRNWTARILGEFRSQAAKERALGLPVAPFMASLDTPIACARLQLSFVSNIVLPLWQRVADLLPGMAEPVSNLNASRLMFEVEVLRWEREKAASATPSAAASASASAAASAAPSAPGSRPGSPSADGKAAPAPAAAAPAASPAPPPPPPVVQAPGAPLVPPRYLPSAVRREDSIKAGFGDDGDGR
jgi:hypothetical protein